MSTVAPALAIFVKTPGLSRVKTRLAQSIGTEAAERFHVLSARAVASVVEAAAERVKGLGAYWAIAEKEALGHPLWKGFPGIHQGEGGLGERLASVYESLQARHGSVLFLGADSPLLPVGVLCRSIELLASGPFVMGLAEDGGFYLFGGRLPVPREIWASVAYSQADTAESLRDGLLALGPVATGLPLLSDVDTVEDLKRLSAVTDDEDSGALTAAQAEALAWARRRLESRAVDGRR